MNLSPVEIVEFIPDKQYACKLLYVVDSLKLFFQVELNFRSELVNTYNIQQHASTLSSITLMVRS